MYRQIEEVRALWRGEPILRQDSRGREVAVSIHPRPVQAELPVWVTSSGNRQTFESAGALGANLLTHLIGQTVEQLDDKVRLYRTARSRAGFDPSAGQVSLMLHTFLGEDLDEVRARVRHPFREYLRSAVGLEQIAALGGGAVSGGHRVEAHEIPPGAMEELLDLAFERYVRDASLVGTVESCAEMVARLEEAGVDEIACLVDFVPDTAAVLESLTQAGRLLASLAEREEQARSSMAGFLEDLRACAGSPDTWTCGKGGAWRLPSSLR
jgi:natural product biosynthesis luciferase-like monooxygenase protein